MALQVGSKAPDFTLYNTDKKEVSLKDFSGKKLVLNFFPAAFTGVCTAQLCSNRDAMSNYNNMNVAVVGISVDLPFSLAEFKKQQNLNFDLLSDFNKNMIKEYGFYLEDFALGYKGVARRGVVLVDENGIVRYMEQTENPGVQVNFDALNQALNQ